jgi:hypothetical protein
LEKKLGKTRRTPSILAHKKMNVEETYYMGHNKVNVEANFSYRSTKYGTRRNPFIWVHKKWN